MVFSQILRSFFVASFLFSVFSVVPAASSVPFPLEELCGYLSSVNADVVNESITYTFGKRTIEGARPLFFAAAVPVAKEDECEAIKKGVAEAVKDTPLLFRFARAAASTDAVDRLVRYGAEVNFAMKWTFAGELVITGRTLLHVAVAENNRAMVGLLLACGISRDAKEMHENVEAGSLSWGVTPLHTVILTDPFPDLGIINDLVSCGVDANDVMTTRFSDGREVRFTALDLAVFYKNREAQRILIDRGGVSAREIALEESNAMPEELATPRAVEAHPVKPACGGAGGGTSVAPRLPVR